MMLVPLILLLEGRFGVLSFPERSGFHTFSRLERRNWTFNGRWEAVTLQGALHMDTSIQAREECHWKNQQENSPSSPSRQHICDC